MKYIFHEVCIFYQEAEILCAFTTEYGKVKKGQDPTKLPRVRVLGESSLQSYIASLGM